MQTFKTAVVVVLLLTVMYGAYVSLTTPPPDNLDELEGLITDIEGIEDEKFGIDDGTGASFAISDGDIVAGASDDAQGPAASADTVPGGAVGRLSDAGAAPSVEFPPSDLPSVPSPDSAAPADSEFMHLADGSTEADSAPRSLPKPSAEATAVRADPSRQYPQTAQGAFALPDPSSVASDFAMPLTEADLSDMNNGSSNNADPAANAVAQSDRADGAEAGDDSETPASAEQPAPAAEKKPQNIGLANAIRTADRLVEADQMKEALATLSVFYNSPDLSDEEREMLLERLDPLAGEVIYSRRHLLEQPHRVGQNETLMEIAAKYDTPWQLLANINGIEDPVVVLPGTELKVVRGPFRAEVNLARSELTVFLGDSYAGRFPIAIGSDPSPQPGTYTVQDKQTAKTYYDATGTPIPPGDARNPFGDVWLDLGKQMCIHGSSSDGGSSGKGCISLKPADAQDVYAILTQGAAVTVRR